MKLFKRRKHADRQDSEELPTLDDMAEVARQFHAGSREIERRKREAKERQQSPEKR